MKSIVYIVLVLLSINSYAQEEEPKPRRHGLTFQNYTNKYISLGTNIYSSEEDFKNGYTRYYSGYHTDYFNIGVGYTYSHKKGIVQHSILTGDFRKKILFYNTLFDERFILASGKYRVTVMAGRNKWKIFPSFIYELKMVYFQKKNYNLSTGSYKYSISSTDFINSFNIGLNYADKDKWIIGINLEHFLKPVYTIYHRKTNNPTLPPKQQNALFFEYKGTEINPNAIITGLCLNFVYFIPVKKEENTEETAKGKKPVKKPVGRRPVPQKRKPIRRK